MQVRADRRRRASRSTPRSCGTAWWPRRRRRSLAGQAALVDAIGLANQGETVLAWDRTTGRPRSAGIVWQDRRSAPMCERLAAERLGPSADARSPASSSTRTSSRRRSSGSASSSARSRTPIWRSPPPTRGCCTGCAGRFVTDVATAVAHAAARSRHRRVERRGLRDRSASIRPRSPHRRQRRVLGETAPCSAATVPVDRRLRRPAGGAVRRACCDGRRGEVHVRHRRVHAGRAPATSRPGRRNGLVGCVGVATRRTSPPGASTARCTPSARRCPG